jgi:hypothetical protein
MKRDTLEPNEALERGKTLPWAFIREYSRVTLGRTPEDVDPEEILEAFFFSPEEEIRLWRQDGSLRAAALTEEAGDRFLEERFGVDDPRLGREITVRKYISFDGDGQACITAVRLSGWKGGEGNE